MNENKNKALQLSLFVVVFSSLFLLLLCHLLHFHMQSIDAHFFFLSFFRMQYVVYHPLQALNCECVRLDSFPLHQKQISIVVFIFNIIFLPVWVYFPFGTDTREHNNIESMSCVVLGRSNGQELDRRQTVHIECALECSDTKISVHPTLTRARSTSTKTQAEISSCQSRIIFQSSFA